MAADDVDHIDQNDDDNDGGGEYDDLLSETI